MARKRHGLEVRIREGRVDIGEVRLGIVGSWVRKGVNLFGRVFGGVFVRKGEIGKVTHEESGWHGRWRERCEKLNTSWRRSRRDGTYC